MVASASSVATDADPPPASPRVTAPVTLSLLLFTSTLGVMAGATLVPVLEVIRTDLGVSGTAAGLIITAHGLAIALTSPIVGRAIDRWGVRPVLASGLTLYGIAGGAGMFTTSYASLVASRFVFGLGAATVFSGTTVAILALYRGPLRDKVMGWRTTASSAGGLLWPLLAGGLGGISWHAPFGIYLVALPLGLATFFLLPETRDQATTPAASAARKPDGGALAMLRRHPALLGFYALMFSTALMMYALAVFLPQRLAEIGIEEPFLVSLYTIASPAAMIVLGLLYARLRARLGYPALLRLAAVGQLTAFVVLGTVSHPVLLLLGPLALGLGQGLAMSALSVLIADTPAPELRGRATALSGTATFAGQFASPLLLGPLVEAASVTTGYLGAAVLAGLVLVALLVARVPVPRAAEEP